MRSFEEWLADYRKDKNRADDDFYPNQVDVFKAGQESRQTEVDELQNNISLILASHKRMSVGLLKQQDKIEKLTIECDELQEQVIAVKQLIQEYHQHSYREADDFVFYLEQALKGGEDAN